MTTCITGTGLYIPPYSISNEELVESFNQYVENYNTEHAEEIAAETMTALEPSSAAFIEKVSGIKSRYVMEKDGILDPEIMAPVIAYRNLGEELSVMAEMGAAALKDALADAGLEANDLDGIILACSNFQRTYPAVAIEIQNAIGMVGGFAYDMNVACSAATFGLSQAHGSIISGLAKRVAVVNVEITSAHLNWRNRDSHFIFGDVCTAMIIERQDSVKMDGAFEVISAKLKTAFSNNIRNNFGFLNRCAPGTEHTVDKLFVQQGRKVFKEVSPLVAEMITDHLAENNIQAEQLKQMWLHQANLNMNQLIAKRVLGRMPEEYEAPVILDEYANTSSAGSIIAFHKNREALQSGDLGVICSFGAGYSVGNIIIRKL